MSNYPPGMTARDWRHVHGPDERVEHRACDFDEVRVVPLHVIKQAVQALLTSKPLALDLSVREVTRVEPGVETTVECWFDGDVDVIYTGSEVVWTCPFCGTQHHEDPPDPGDVEPDRDL